MSFRAGFGHNVKNLGDELSAQDRITVPEYLRLLSCKRRKSAARSRRKSLSSGRLIRNPRMLKETSDNPLGLIRP
ncbi:unnamed protein product [Parnassius mnemosyne]|uniref:Uncharacterized protein n=1 Tax=Parnassius mnemosyne TaxID=213953 RepID=A0AAV1L0I1_9NEOP